MCQVLEVSERDMRIGAKEAESQRKRDDEFLTSVLKMRIMRIGVITEALVFMRNYKHRGCIVQENGCNG